MIARPYRFHGLNALRTVYGRGQTVRGPLLAIKYLANPRRRQYRAAVVVSRKVHKSAVVRNRIRRRVYEIIRGLAPQFTQPMDIVVTVFSEAAGTVAAPELQSMVEEQLRRTGVLASMSAIVEPIKPIDPK